MHTMPFLLYTNHKLKINTKYEMFLIITRYSCVIQDIYNQGIKCWQKSKNCYLHPLPPLLSVESEIQLRKLHALRPNHNIEVEEQGTFTEQFILPRY